MVKMHYIKTVRHGGNRQAWYARLQATLKISAAEIWVTIPPILTFIYTGLKKKKKKIRDNSHTR